MRLHTSQEDPKINISYRMIGLLSLRRRSLSNPADDSFLMRSLTLISRRMMRSFCLCRDAKTNTFLRIKLVSKRTHCRKSRSFKVKATLKCNTHSCERVFLGRLNKRHDGQAEDTSWLGYKWAWTHPMVRLLSSKAQECKVFWNPFKPYHVGIHRKAVAEYSQMSTHLPGFQSVFRFLA